MSSDEHLPSDPRPPRVIQFPHPGFEYTAARYLGPKSQRTGVMEWKEEDTEHNRKYLLATGSVASKSGAVREGVRLGFWGEWEAPSRWIRADGAVKRYYPSVFHEPSLPAERPAGSHQNTDPLVFGDAFLYTNCKMYRRAMRGMPSGSIVLFGRGMNIHGEPRFVLDTCFVVDHRHDPVEAVRDDQPAYGEDLLTDMVLAPLLSSEKSSGHVRIHHYVGRRPAPGSGEPFSFFPAVEHDKRREGFARPVLRPTGALKGLLTETLKQGLKPSTVAGEAESKAVWLEVVDQVLKKDCLLGVHAQPPMRGAL